MKNNARNGLIKSQNTFKIATALNKNFLPTELKTPGGSTT